MNVKQNFKRTAHATLTYKHTHIPYYEPTNSVWNSINQLAMWLYSNSEETEPVCFVLFCFRAFSLWPYTIIHTICIRQTKHLMLYPPKKTTTRKKIYYIINNNLIESKLCMCVYECEWVRMYAFTIWFRRVWFVSLFKCFCFSQTPKKKKHIVYRARDRWNEITKISTKFHIVMCLINFLIV